MDAVNKGRCSKQVGPKGFIYLRIIQPSQPFTLRRYQNVQRSLLLSSAELCTGLGGVCDRTWVRPCFLILLGSCRKPQLLTALLSFFRAWASGVGAAMRRGVEVATGALVTPSCPVLPSPSQNWWRLRKLPRRFPANWSWRWERWIRSMCTEGHTLWG